MKRIFLLAGLALPALAAFAPATASAQDWYVKASVGQTVDALVGGSFDLSDGGAMGAHLGTRVGPFRVEGGIDRMTAEADLGYASLDGSALSYNGSLFLDLPVGESASLFGGVGLDYVTAEAAYYGSSMDASGNGWHASFGGAYIISDTLSFEVEATRLDADLDFGGNDLNLKAWTITGGLRFVL